MCSIEIIFCIYIYIYICRTSFCIYSVLILRFTNKLKRDRTSTLYSIHYAETMDSSESASKQPCQSASNERKLQSRRERDRAHRASETAAEKEEWLRKRRVRDQAKRAAESEEQRDARLQQKRTRKSERLTAETEQQRENMDPGPIPQQLQVGRTCKCKYSMLFCFIAGPGCRALVLVRIKHWQQRLRSIKRPGWRI